MTTSSHARIVARCRQFALATAVGTPVIGGLVLIGWAFDVHVLRDPVPALAAVLVALTLVASAVVWKVAATLDRSDQEGRRAERRLAAQYTAARILAESPDPADAVPNLLCAVSECLGWEVGAMWRVV